MKKVKLARLPDRTPAKMQLTLPPDLAARLRDYADLYAETYGVREEPADLVPYMLDAFLRGDAEFRKALRKKAGKEDVSGAAGEKFGERSSPIVDDRQRASDEEVRELRKPRRLVNQPPDGMSD